MHENNILKIQNETIKIISEIQNLLENSEILKKNHFKTLENEKKKLENLEFVISIVGTVKAGKSTTINAIVGQEILPNRSAPMTTLPTLVTHKRGQVEPSLTMPKYEVLNDFLKNVKKELKKDKSKDATFLKDSHGQEILKELDKDNFKFKYTYQNREEIFNFLKTLNDLMRLAKDLGLKPPYNEFEKIDELPRIEVEFYYLNNMENIHNAKLSLLDTPGPDEFGHSEELKNIFTTQLKQSSAIILVMNYTVINNEGAGKTRQEVQEIQKLIEKDHLFVLANKFDERTSKDPDYEQTKQNISKSMFDETINVDNIFPLSSKWAYLVNLAKREIELNKKIDKNLSWAEDFGKTVLGALWEDDIDDIERIKKICVKKYEDSYFEKPLNKIIIHGYSNTTFKSLSSVLHKIKSINEESLNIFKVNENSLNKDIETLYSDISNLKEDVNNISFIQKNLDEDIKNELSGIKKNIENSVKDFLNNAKIEIGKIYDNKEDNQKQNMIDQSQKINNNTNFLGVLLGGKKNKNKNKTFKMNGSIRFENESDAKLFINELNKNLKQNIDNTLNELDIFLKKQIDIFIPNLNEKIEKNIGTIIEKIKERVGDNIKIKIPALEIDKNGNIVGSYLEEAIESKSESIKKLRKQSGLWGATKRLFDWGGNDWGKDEYYVDNQYFQLTKQNIANKVDMTFKDVSIFIKETTTIIFEHQIKKEITESVNKLIVEIENYREEMISVTKKAQADAFDKKKAIVSAKNNQEISIRLSARIEKTSFFLKEELNEK